MTARQPYDELLGDIVVASGLAASGVPINIGVQTDEATGLPIESTITPIGCVHHVQSVLHDPVDISQSGILKLNAAANRLEFFLQGGKIKKLVRLLKDNGPELFEAYCTGPGETTIDQVGPTNIRMNELRINSAPELFDFQLGQTQVELLEDGTYEIECRVTYQNTTGTRTQAVTSIMRNSIEEAGARAWTYHRNASEGRDTANIRIILSDIVAGDIISIAGQIISGAANLNTDGNACSVSIRRLFD